MKNLILFTFLLLTASIGFAQVASPVTNKAAKEVKKAGPVLHMESNVIDFGTIEQGSDPYRALVFTNAGSAPLIIKNAKGSCGCTVPTWPKEPIMPGASDTLKVKYDTKRIGVINKVVSLYTNQSDQPISVKIKGQVNPKPKEPEALPVKNKSILNGSND